MEKKNRNIIIINIFSKNQPKFCLFCRPRGPISKLCLRRSSCSSWLDFKFIPLLKSYIVLQNPEKSYDFKLGQNLASLFCIHTYAFNYYIAVSRYVFTIPQGTISNSITYFFPPSSSYAYYISLRVIFFSSNERYITKRYCFIPSVSFFDHGKINLQKIKSLKISN